MTDYLNDRATYCLPDVGVRVLQSFPYRLNEETGLIDYDLLEANAKLYRPKLLVAGASAYTRHYDYPRMRQIADNHNAYLLSDMAHISGLVAAGERPTPCSVRASRTGSEILQLGTNRCK